MIDVLNFYLPSNSSLKWSGSLKVFFIMPKKLDSISAIWSLNIRNPSVAICQPSQQIRWNISRKPAPVSILVWIASDCKKSCHPRGQKVPVKNNSFTQCCKILLDLIEICWMWRVTICNGDMVIELVWWLFVEGNLPVQCSPSMCCHWNCFNEKRLVWGCSQILTHYFLTYFRTFYRKHIKFVGTLIFGIKNRLMFFIF